MTSPGWIVRPGAASDLDQVLSIEQACPEAPHWSLASWLQILSEAPDAGPARATFIAVENHRVLGFAVAALAANIAELESIAVSPSARRQGIGRALCTHAMNWSKENGGHSIELEVRASSESALHLYRSLGFVEQGRRRGYYRDPPEDAILMAATLHPV